MTHTTAFAGIFGAVTAPQKGDLTLPSRALSETTAHMLLQILRDITPPATQTDDALLRRVAAYDDAALKSADVGEEIDMGLAALNALSLRLTKQNYVDVPQTAMRRNLLTQMSEHPLMQRLGIQFASRQSAAAY